MKRILVVQNLKPEDREILIRRLGGLYETVFPDDYSAETLARIVADVDICIGTSLPDRVVESARDGLIFQSLGTGVDRLNLRKMAEKGMSVCNSHSHSIYVAEFAVSLLFALIKKIHLHDRMMRAGIWWRPLGHQEDLLYLSDTIIGRKVGFLGFGHIGQHIAKMLKGFEVQVSAFDRSQRMVVDGCPEVKFRTFQEIVSESDAVFVVLPLTDNTVGMIGIDELASAKVTSLWVHISRGPVIREKDLYDAISQNKIAGIAIDNWFSPPVQQDGGTYPSVYPFHRCDNVLLSPYRAIYVKGISPHLEDALVNLEGFAARGVLSGLVDLSNGY
jgi:phosphoglycerate dehydrogenase-like enzyme